MNISMTRESSQNRYEMLCRQNTYHTTNERMLTINEKRVLFKLRRRYRRTQSILSFYDNHAQDVNETVLSKWVIVRQRLPDILALSKTYKPKSVRAQLLLLIALMNRQADQLPHLHCIDFDFDFNFDSSSIPTTVIINIDGRNRLIYLKSIPLEQMIYVDIEGLSFSLSTRQFIVAISRGMEHRTAIQYCPPAMSDMLINLSKTKVVDDGKLYKRQLVKMRIGQICFFLLFIFISGMILALLISMGNTLFKLRSMNFTKSTIPLATFQPTISADDDYKRR